MCLLSDPGTFGAAGGKARLEYSIKEVSPLFGVLFYRLAGGQGRNARESHEVHQEKRCGDRSPSSKWCQTSRFETWFLRAPSPFRCLVQTASRIGEKESNPHFIYDCFCQVATVAIRSTTTTTTTKRATQTPLHGLLPSWSHCLWKGSGSST